MVSRSQTKTSVTAHNTVKRDDAGAHGNEKGELTFALHTQLAQRTASAFRYAAKAMLLPSQSCIRASLYTAKTATSPIKLQQNT